MSLSVSFLLLTQSLTYSRSLINTFDLWNEWMNVHLTGTCQMQGKPTVEFKDLWEWSSQNDGGNPVKGCVQIHTHSGWDRREWRLLNHLCYIPGLTGEWLASKEKGISSPGDERRHRQLAVVVRGNFHITHLQRAPDSGGVPVWGGHPAKATCIVTCQHYKQVQAAEGSAMKLQAQSWARLHPPRRGGDEDLEGHRLRCFIGLCSAFWMGRISVKLCNWRLS